MRRDYGGLWKLPENPADIREESGPHTLNKKIDAANNPSKLVRGFIHFPEKRPPW